MASTIKLAEAKLCRLCLSTTVTYESLLENKILAEKLLLLTAMIISSDDVISTVICLKCQLNLSLAYKIQQDMIKAEERFHQRMVFKEEPELPFVNEESLFSCETCAKECISRAELTRHRYMHRRKKCLVCGKEVSASNMHTHLDSHTYDPQVCELCGATLKTKNNLRQHMFYTHNDSRHKCNYCDKVFKKKSYRDAHQKKEHLEEPTHVCDTCGKKFFSIGNLNGHIKMTHLKLRPYLCEFCNSRFSSSFALRTHRRQHTNETPYRCEICGEGFRQKVSLKSHLKSKHKIVEKITCECSICGKGFASAIALNTHQRLQICTAISKI